MEPVSNAARIAALFRQRLLERARARPVSSESAVGTGEVDALRALAAAEGAEDRHLRRALVQDILADQLGRHLLNESQFQQVVENVVAALEDDGEAAGLLSTVIKDLRTGAR